MLINIGEIIYKKSGKRLPRWIIRPLEKLIHQRELNEIWATGKDLSAIEFLRHTLNYLEVSYEVHYTTPLPEEERYIFASNHPFGGMDGMMLIDALHRRWGDSGAIVNDLLMNVKPLAPLFIAVNKYGRQDAEKSLRYDEALSSESKQLLTFPAGFCSRYIDGRVQDTEWKHRFIKDAERYNRKVVPTFVDGKLSKRFYRIYRLRRLLHINVNIELVLLVDEMFRQRGKRIDIYVGNPIDVTTMEGNAKQRCETIRELSYGLQPKK